jgi:hypothetical protein
MEIAGSPEGLRDVMEIAGSPEGLRDVCGLVDAQRTERGS